MLTKADIDWLKSEYLPSLADEVENRLNTKIDEISTKLDTFIGEIKDKRSEQVLHKGDHDRIDNRLSKLEKHTKLTPFAD